MQSERNSYFKIYAFNNGYGASVVCNQNSYGGDNGLFELAVLDNNGDICYDTPITSDVIGYMTFDHVTRVLKSIESL